MKSSSRSLRRMRRSSPRIAWLIACLAVAACDDPTARDAAPKPDDAASPQVSRETRREGERSLGGVRQRADDAFAELEAGFARSESRVGPQPWPEGLPQRWPRPADATVVADTRQAEGERLLLLNIPGPVERAVDSYAEALRANGYRVDRPRTNPMRDALHVRNGDQEAILTFVAREKVTRVEILFLSRAAG